jgi:DNA-binding NarL/FixJ family response regulator
MRSNGLGWLQSLLDKVPYGLGVISCSLEILLINRNAEKGFEAFGEKLDAVDCLQKRNLSVQMERLARAVMQATTGSRQMVLFSRAGEQLAIAVSPFQLDDGNVGALLTTESINQSDSLSLLCYGRLLGLTSTEIKVIEKLLQGAGPESAAAGLSISIATVRSHIRSILSKTESSCLRTLLLRLAKLPPLALDIQSGRNL